MARELETSVVIDLEGNLQQRAKRYEKSLASFSKNGTKKISRLKRSFKGLGRSIDKIGNRYIALGTGAGAIAAVKSVSDLSSRMNQLGIDAGFNGAKLHKFKQDSITAIETAADKWGVSTDQITTGIEGIVKKTGNIKFATENMGNLALAMGATSGQGSVFGQMLAELAKMEDMTPDKVTKALDMLVAQGQQGAFVLGDMAAHSATLFADYGPENIQQMKEMGAAMQVMMAATGKAPEAVTAFTALRRTLTSKDKVKPLLDAGVSIFDPEKYKLAKEGALTLTEALLPITTIMKSIAEVSKGDVFTVNDWILDTEARKGLKNILTEQRNTGKTESIDLLLAVKGDGKSVTEDATDNLKELNNQMERLATSWGQFANTNLAGPVGELADELGQINADELNETLDTIKKVVLGIGGAVVALKAVRLGFGAFNSVRTAFGKGGGNPLSSASGSLTPIPVYVVNAPSKLLGLGFDGDARSKHKFGRAGKFANKLTGGLTDQRVNMKSLRAMSGPQLLKSAGLLGLAGAAGYGIGTVIHKTLLEGTTASDKIGEGIANVLAFFGNDEAQNALDRRERFAKMEIEITGDGAKNASVKSITSSDDLDVEAGGSMGSL
jgi:hypothetical protein